MLVTLTWWWFCSHVHRTNTQWKWLSISKTTKLNIRTYLIISCRLINYCLYVTPRIKGPLNMPKKLYWEEEVQKNGVTGTQWTPPTLPKPRYGHETPFHCLIGPGGIQCIYHEYILPVDCVIDNKISFFPGFISCFLQEIVFKKQSESWWNFNM